MRLLTEDYIKDLAKGYDLDTDDVIELLEQLEMENVVKIIDII